ncbi:MAG: hypothetical protein CM15mP3_10600 [Candidatus Poseidoniales archaeon]|nr:MAG: hypothetical protein CM15mP3_10600 [Candidatus Poseidoniales archaeon]
MDEELSLKYWKDAGHVARRTLEAMKENRPEQLYMKQLRLLGRYIHRHGGKPAFPGTIAVNDIAAHFTTDPTSPGRRVGRGYDSCKRVVSKSIMVFTFKGHIGDNV